MNTFQSYRNGVLAALGLGLLAGCGASFEGSYSGNATLTATYTNRQAPYVSTLPKDISITDPEGDAVRVMLQDLGCVLMGRQGVDDPTVQLSSTDEQTNACNFKGPLDISNGDHRFIVEGGGAELVDGTLTISLGGLVYAQAEGTTSSIGSFTYKFVGKEQ